MDFFNANPLIAVHVPIDPATPMGKPAYDVVDHADQLLAKAFQDLGDGGGGGLLRDFAQSMTNSYSYLVFDAHEQLMLSLAESRGHGKSTTTVAWAAGQAIGSITMERSLSVKSYWANDAYGNLQARIEKLPDDRGFLEILADPNVAAAVYLVKDAHDHEIARITDSKQMGVGGIGMVSHHILEVRYPQLGEPLSTLLRVATIVMHFAELRD
ncbi:hypothetical protein J4H86_18000 [Spiractinospora alimapuensis]|uniref:hypothetical protein n=1 Tax=Spiractinospora alimapuensis TaxID=2820884 RepID=UPI001F29AFD7|nr:hypothetical protein [Spiractinospora alimapuensis]QVQ50760.1 hypothetical protein J4H86_18000 [Spiractinospora alimapuensis]